VRGAGGVRHAGSVRAESYFSDPRAQRCASRGYQLSIVLTQYCPDLGFPTAEPTSNVLQPTGYKTAAHMPDLLPPSALMRYFPSASLSQRICTRSSLFCRGIATVVTQNRSRRLTLRSLLGRINRRDQERQRQKNYTPQLRQEFQAWIERRGGIQTVETGVAKEPPRDWDVRWMPVPSVDVVLSSGMNLDGSRWSADWPNKASTYYHTLPQPAASGAAVQPSISSAASAAKQPAPAMHNARAPEADAAATAEMATVSLTYLGSAAAAAAAQSVLPAPSTSR